MTLGQMNYIMEKNNVHYNAKIMSDSGWECGPSDCDGVYYNRTENIIMICQGDTGNDRYYREHEDWDELKF